MDRLALDTEDRYGHLNQTVKNLVELTRVRLMGSKIGLRSIDILGSWLQFRFHENPKVDHEKMLAMVQEGKAKLSPTGAFRVPAPEQASQRLANTQEWLRWFSE